VLPFVNMSEDKANEFFSHGISEELLNLLAKIPQLQVTARTSSFAFKGKEIVIPEIARTLHVAHVLEGSVRKSGNAVRITAQLIRAGTDTHLWSQTYDCKLDDIFAIQDEIAADVVRLIIGCACLRRCTKQRNLELLEGGSGCMECSANSRGPLQLRLGAVDRPARRKLNGSRAHMAPGPAAFRGHD